MVEITDRQALQAWLKTQPMDVSVMIASRAALRVLPLLNELPKITTQERDKIVLSVFRATAISWAATGYSVERKSITTAASAVFAAGKIAKSASVSAAAILAANAAANTTTFAAFAASAEASNSAADVATAATLAASATIYKSVSDDATQIEAGKSAKDMMVTPLWSDDNPEPLMEKWQQLKSKLLAADEDWQVWTDWYEARLFGTPKPIEKLEIARAEIDDALWQQGSKVVNAHIQTLIEEYTPKPNKEPSLEQRPAPYLYFTQEDGVIDARPMLGQPDDKQIAEDMRAGLAGKVQALIERLEQTQAAPSVKDNLKHLLDVLQNAHDEVRIGQLLDAADLVEADMSAYDTEEGRRELALDAFSKLKAVHISLGKYKGVFPEIAKIEAAALAQQISGKEEAVLEQTKAIIESVENNPDGVSEAGQKGLKAGLAEIKTMMEKIAYEPDDLKRAELLRKLTSLTARHSLNALNFSIVVVAMEAKRTSQVFLRKLQDPKTPLTVPIAVSGLVYAMAGAVSGLAALGITAWIQLKKESDKLKDEEKQKNNNKKNENTE